MSDLISRQAAIDAIDEYDFEFPNYMERFVTELRDAMKADLKNDIEALPPAQAETPCYLGSPCEYQNPDAKLPSAQPERLTDKEQRIFLAAMGREEKVCKQVDEECRDCREPYEDSLVSVCREIKRKVKGVLWTCGTDEDVPF